MLEREEPDSPHARGGRARCNRRRGFAAYDSEIAALRQDARHRLQRRQLIERSYRLGPRVIVECIEDLVCQHELDQHKLESRLEAFAGLDPDALAITGGDRLPPAPLRLVKK